VTDGDKEPDHVVPAVLAPGAAEADPRPASADRDLGVPPEREERLMPDETTRTTPVQATATTETPLPPQLLTREEGDLLEAVRVALDKIETRIVHQNMWALTGIDARYQAYGLGRIAAHAYDARQEISSLLIAARVYAGCEVAEDVLDTARTDRGTT
jgi:hypothetical protein